ncbi:BTAD domain-containing putative transcriptional regulator [Actinoplanes sp. DH11]|uniref:AfsR/SARP family transcriptional regulator n=1 Tax=Actinoplanes sp. DH11 TaxID=2857011 RepID=UPI001E32123E|nr:BTAD domain-containing putative transcriptional regulator [Actinoplanes sp. DH11]
MEFRLLGPVEAFRDGEQVSLGGTKIRTLLAALLLEPRRVVPTDRLIDILWDDDPPGTARALVQTYVSTLRRAVGDEAVITQAPGYQACVRDEDLDRHRFATLVGQGRAAAADGRHRQAANALRAAELLWRGPALGGVRSRILAAEAARLDEQRVAAVEARIAAELELGRNDELIGELTVLVGQHPTRSTMRGQLMLALHRADRTAEALTVFRQGREALIEELGLEPGPELTVLHERILRADPALLGPEPAAPQQHPRRGPAQLPPDPPGFVGREALIGELGTALAEGPAVVALLGPGGVGKSALAAHVAHRAASAYPDGQLHVDLRGNTDTPASPAEVLGRFLRALEPQQAVPDGADERMDAYRTVLAGRRVLIVLDDAAGEQQVRPLLPGSGGSSVLVTSRSKLGGLAGARLVELDLLSTAEATALLTQVVGVDRIAPASQAAAEIVAACGNLPLAVRVAGARLASRRQWTAALMAGRLRDERRRLDELSAGDQQVRVSIALSFASLDPVAHTAICWLGHLGLSDFRSWVLAYALDTDIRTAERILEQLVDAHLVDYTYVDDTGLLRYRLHDLIRIYAREQAEEHEDRDRLVAATRRVVQAWSAALNRLSQHIADHVTSGAVLPVVPPPGADADPEVVGNAVSDPRGWLDMEQTSLVLAVERAAELGLAQQAVAVAAVLCASRYALGNVPDLWNRAHRAALGAARAAGDAHAEAVLIAELGQLRYEQDQFTESRQHLAEAAERFRDLGDARGQASALSALGLACREQGYLPEAVHFLKQAAELSQTLGDDRAAGHCARVLGSVHLERGDFAATEQALNAAMAAYRRAGSRRGEALSLRTIGLAHRAQGRLAEAEQALNRALAIFEELGDRSLIAFSRRALAKTYVRMGRLEQAREPLQEALAVHQAMGDQWGEAMVLRTMGELELAAGRLDDAAKWLSAALEIFRGQEAALFCARTLRDIADLESARGDRVAAETARAEALRAFRTFGAREYHELCN